MSHPESYSKKSQVQVNLGSSPLRSDSITFPVTGLRMEALAVTLSALSDPFLAHNRVLPVSLHLSPGLTKAVS